MKKLLLLCLSILLVCFSFVSTALADFETEIDYLKIEEVICPGTVKAGKSLVVTVYVENEGEDCEPSPVGPTVEVRRFMVGLVGNPVGSIGGTGYWGPFPRSISSPVSVPPCQTVRIDNVKIVDSVPSSLIGKMAGVALSLLSPANADIPNEPRSGGGCLVQVVAP